MFGFENYSNKFPLFQNYLFEITFFFICSSIIIFDIYYFDFELIAHLGKINIEKSVHMTMASVSAIILAFFIPHSLEIVANISERYHSEVVTKPYTSRWEQVWFPIILIIHILITTLLLFVENMSDHFLWKIFSSISICLFLYIVPKAGHYHFRTKKFVSSTDHILDNLFNRAEEIIE